MPGGQSRQQDAEEDQSVKTAERAGPAVGMKDNLGVVLEHNPFHWLLLVRPFNRKRGSAGPQKLLFSQVNKNHGLRREARKCSKFEEKREDNRASKRVGILSSTSDPVATPESPYFFLHL